MARKNWTVCIEVEVKAGNQDAAWRIADYVRVFGIDKAREKFGDLIGEYSNTNEPEEYTES